MNEYEGLLGICIIRESTGKHETHYHFTPEELSMPGYPESIEKQYEGTGWVAVRFYCASLTKKDYELRG